MDNRLNPEQENAIIEDALKNYPLAPMPRSITVNVMARIQKDVRLKLVTWKDFSLSLTIALCFGALLFAMQNLPPIMVVKLRIQGILLYQELLINVHWLAPVLFFGLAVFLFALTIQLTTDHRR
jgi:hypothetical protein